MRGKNPVRGEAIVEAGASCLIETMDRTHHASDRK
jgi:hypothetical protein